MYVYKRRGESHPKSEPCPRVRQTSQRIRDASLENAAARSRWRYFDTPDLSSVYQSSGLRAWRETVYPESAEVWVRRESLGEEEEDVEQWADMSDLYIPANAVSVCSCRE